MAGLLGLPSVSLYSLIWFPQQGRPPTSSKTQIVLECLIVYNVLSNLLIYVKVGFFFRTLEVAMSRESDNSLSAFQAPRILPLPPGSTRSADLLRRIILWRFGTSSPPPRSCSSSCSSCDTSVPVPPVIRAAPKVRTFQATNAANGWMRLIFVLAWYFTRHLPDARAPCTPWIYQRLVYPSP